MSPLAIKLNRQLTALAALLATMDRDVLQGRRSAGAAIFARKERS